MKFVHPSSRACSVTLRIGIVLLMCLLFVGVALAAGLTDASVDDFYRGSGCYVSQADTGQIAGAVIITPTAGTIFSGTAPDTGWFVTGDSLVSGGNLSANEGTGGTTATYSAGRDVEFVATFQGVDSQHGGFALDFFELRWAIFSTRDNGAQLWARSENSTNTEETPLGSGYLGTPHYYRIDWEPTQVIYSIDGLAVATHTITIVDMRPLFADFSGNTNIVLPVNWVRMSDYTPSPCTYTSRIINSGADSTAWSNFTTTVDTPAGTSVSFEVRASNTQNDLINDIEPWTLVTSNSINITGRYVQYQATLTTTDPLVTPQVLDVSFGGNPLAVTLTSISAAPTTPSGTGWLIASLSGAGLLVIIYGHRLVKRRRRI